MEKLAPVQYPILDLLRRRWSPHVFAARAVEPVTLRRLLEAARWAPSCFNEQPWSFIIATSDDAAQHQRMLHCLVEGNRLWAKTAPVLMLSVATLAFARNGHPNRHAFHDVGQAIAKLTVQATEEGIFLHQMAGFDLNKARETYQIPTAHEPVAAIALGYPGDINILPDAIKQRTLSPRTRKSIDQFTFTGKFGQTAPQVKVI